eukprot:CAMPEP_0114656010 /NCGR_PEP_ID=MMETSP0191-20121206/11725_1 /TAXON_ID=126664 /ORGANISM="Sorites sp." /LENGTH=186 /DNA_ID=CAMNT_0001872415 /DNA_START=92 /DNA_END=652 /DNA_ORIENTATION=+
MKKLLLLFGFVMHSLGSQLGTDNNYKNGDRIGSSDSHPGSGRNVRQELPTPDFLRANVREGVPVTPDTPPDTPPDGREFREPRSSEEPEHTLHYVQSRHAPYISSRPNSAGGPQTIPEDGAFEVHRGPLNTAPVDEKGQLPGSDKNRLKGFGYRDPEARSDVSEAATTTASTVDSTVSTQSNHGKG